MKLLTQVDIPDYPFSMEHYTAILMMGSCFTENIGGILERYLFPVCINPFGVIYNPLSVAKGLEALLHHDQYRAEDLERHHDLWFSFDHYTRFSSPDRDEALQKINKSFLEAKEVLRNARILVITFGTAWVYRYRPTGEVVCNCHKIPASQFSRSRLVPEEITAEYTGLLSALFGVNKDLKVLLTVSPVRHWKDGAHGNQLSKATLLLACEQLTGRFGDRVFYFPSYEIVMDELRDYRFYADDMLHMNSQSTSYIWEKLEHSLISEDSRKIIGDLKPMLGMLEHRPHRTLGESYQKMMKQRDKKLDELKQKYPGLQWEQLEAGRSFV